MELKNPQTFQYGHPNFGPAKTEISLNDIQSDELHLVAKIVAPDGRVGEVKFQFNDNGNVLVQAWVSPSGPVRIGIADAATGNSLFQYNG